MLTNNDKTPIKAIVSYQNFNYNNLRKIHGGSNTYICITYYSLYNSSYFSLHLQIIQNGN